MNAITHRLSAQTAFAFENPSVVIWETIIKKEHKLNQGYVVSVFRIA